MTPGAAVPSAREQRITYATQGTQIVPYGAVLARIPARRAEAHGGGLATTPNTW